MSNVKKYLDALVDDNGLKTELTITLTHQTLTRLSLYLIGTVVVSSLAWFAVRAVVNANKKPIT